ncbi:uncharacterized protein LOC111257871 [Setaria italica]|uniref:uncharacterized protein LOC111257871 n=1 Tax=Setaria italica TaxID=4555 RepID=UPI000BE555B4|nr:uncharacterized protein LOC111257871 [Setaria italica]
MAEASRGYKGKALVQYSDGLEEEDALRVYRFQVLLPSGVSTSLTLHNPGEEMLVRDLLLSVKRELNNASVGGGRMPEIQWDDNIFLTDLLDEKITDKIKLSNFDTKSTNILRLHDEKGEPVSTFENMWDLTPQPDLVQELPAEYSTESALVDLTDNALQALWSNGIGERKLIRITLVKEKIVIFDTGRGMDGSDANSICKCPSLACLVMVELLPQCILEGIEKSVYLTPFKGGIAGKSRTSTSGLQTAGGVRDPSEEERLLSPHQSFTQVEICGLKKHLEADRLLGFLKDVYFPYIQYDEDIESMNTRNPVEFEVNGVNLAEVQEGEVTVTNLHSSNGPDFIWHLKFTEKTAASCQAHARLKCVYFPIVKGKESIDSILEKLRNDGYEMKENFDNFSRGPLPFMEAKYRKGHKAEFFRRCCKRVKCFVAEVDVEARDKDRKLISYNQLEKQYYDWIKEMHDKYDVEMDGGDDEPTLIINPKCKERLGISNDGEARLICRPLGYSDEQGCLVDEAADCMSPNIYIQESVSFPVSIIDNRMKKEKAAKWIEIIRNSGLDALGLEGDLPYEGDVMAGYQPPHEIVAVLRPGNYMPSSTCLLETKYIVKDDQLEMSCRGSNVIQQQTTITVCPDLNSRRCLFSVAGSSTDNAPVDIRLGYPVRRLAVKSVDQHGNKIPFLDTSGIIITILNGDDVLAQVNDVEVELSSDLLTMNVMLDILRPKYEAKLRISSSDNEFSVKPGLPSIINMDMSLFSEENLIPGRVIDNVLLEVLDQFSNHVEEGTKLNVHVDGLCFLDKKSSVQKKYWRHFSGVSYRATNELHCVIEGMCYPSTSMYIEE